MKRNPVLIGGASAFWGDSALGPAQLCRVPGLHYLVFDYLAELTMSILAAARMKNAELGFATDFVDITLREILGECLSRGITVIANAGGVNPQACARRLEALAAEQGHTLAIAVVDGDDVSTLCPQLREAGVSDFYSGQPMPARLISANAYLGALPIARALAMGAQVVITGRVVDSALTLGALVHEFGWEATDYDRIAQGSLAGHLIECGAQATGGLFTDWQSVPDWAGIGYPYLECQPDGNFCVTKPRGSGGLISVAALSEQLVYEIDDPARYILPDAICDFSRVVMEQQGSERVRVTGARGHPPTTSYKVSATYQDGFRCVASLTIAGFAAGAKARRSGEAILERTRRFFRERGWQDYLGVELGVLGNSDENAFGDAVLRLAVSHPEKAALELFAREIATAGTSFAPGTTGSLAAGRPPVSARICLFTFLIDKHRVKAHVQLGDGEEFVAPAAAASAAAPDARAVPVALLGGVPADTPSTGVEVALIEIAHGRSGDKGDRCNIGLIAREPALYETLCAQLTASVVRAHLKDWIDGDVVRYELPGIHGLNFVLERALGGGGMASLRADPLGKAMAQRLLTLRVRVAAELLPRTRTKR
jgi:hypothetical protein